MKDQGAEAALVEALKEAGLPSAKAGNALIERFCVGQTLTVAAERMGDLAAGVQHAIAADAPRVLVVLLKQRLETLSALQGYDGTIIDLQDAAIGSGDLDVMAFLSLLAPEVTNGN